MVGSMLDKKAKTAIVEAIVNAEKRSTGEIRVHVTRKACRDMMAEAKKTFQKLGMHKTKHRNGILLFVSWKNRELAILGDQGIHDQVGDSFWSQTRDKMIRYFREGRIEEGIVAGVTDAGEKLQKFFPAEHDKNPNELDNTVTEN